MHIAPAHPIIRILSEPEARQYYVDYLGFTMEWEHRFEDGMPLYAQIRRSDLVLHLSGHAGDAIPGANVFVPVNDIEALHRDLSSREYGFPTPAIVDLPWGRQIQIADPFGNRLRFCQLAS